MTPEQLLPHAAPMVLLDRVIETSDSGAVCELDIRPGIPFADDQGVPMWVGIEYMAQCIGVFAGAQAKALGEPIKVGFLIGTRKFDSDVTAFRHGQTLRVAVEKVLEQDNGLSVFSCTLDGPDGGQRAQINVFQPQDAAAFLNGEAS
ncbi:hypothetical protein [Gallaecimonas sp. GXIMD4217]|uniref:ApeP family dehydratase n=1 Tax=Gallaecimonas sp. GXIMD4217 TaxID=3131927 RepID=UPI00311B0477